MEAVAYGYFDDLLIGNFMKTRLHGRATLYPFVTPIIAKIGGNAKVFTRAQYRAFLWHYFRRNPIGFVGWRLHRWAHFRLIPLIRNWAERAGLLNAAKRIYRGWIHGDPVR